MNKIGNQISFWGNIDYPTNKDALKARNAEMRRLKGQGITCYGFTLPNQMRKYSDYSFDGRIGNAYYIQIKEETNG